MAQQLSAKAVEDWKKLVKKKCGVDLSDDEAQTMALEWLEMFKLVYEPMKEGKK